jgi:CRP-like cAMP-binding protein
MTSLESGHNQIGNRILAALPEREYQALSPKLQTVSLPSGHLVLEQGRPVRFIYFPVTAMIALLSMGEEDTRGIEVCTVGCEGVAGLSVFLDGDIALGRGVVQLPGEAVRVEAAAFKDAANSMRVFRGLLKRYTQVQVFSIARAAFCINFHKIDARLARLLLLTHDSARADTFPLTQQFAARLLASHRPAISIAANALQTVGLISYRQGRITVLDRQGLQTAACECYSYVTREYERLLGDLLTRKS